MAFIRELTESLRVGKALPQQYPALCMLSKKVGQDDEQIREDTDARAKESSPAVTARIGNECEQQKKQNLAWKELVEKYFLGGDLYSSERGPRGFPGCKARRERH